MAKFFIDPKNIDEKYIYLREKNDLHHLVKVLRSKIGDEIEISDGSTWEYITVIDDIFEDEAVLKIVDKQKFATEPKTRVSLYQGVPKGQKMELIIQKTVELGIDTITPVFMERTVVEDHGKFDKKIERWQKISDEAVKQCKRGMIPEITGKLTYKEMLNELKNFDLVLIPYEDEEGTTIKDVLRDFVKESSTKESSAKPQIDTMNSHSERSEESCRVAVIIGPEGGFTENEVKLAVESGAKSVTLGKTTLRTETAGIAALAMIMYELEL